MMKKIFYSLLAVSLIAFLAFCVACYIGWTMFTIWGMMISGIAVVVLVFICSLYWHDVDFNDPNVRFHNLFE